MQIILVRHGIAEDFKPDSNRKDSARELTKKGRKQLRKVARGLHRTLEHVDCVASSPYIRAVQSAEILVRAFKTGREPVLEVVDALKSGSGAKNTVAWLARQNSKSRVALVGHEPDLSGLMSYLTTSAGQGQGYAKFSKAGACLVDCPSTPGVACGRLVWLATPVMLERLGTW